jgi:hypothetical protein
VKPPLVPRKQKVPDPIKKKSTMKKICFSQFQNGGRVYFRFTDFQIFLIVEFFLWPPVAPELGTDPRLDLARTAPLKMIPKKHTKFLAGTQ